MSIAGDLGIDPKPDPAPVTIAVLPASGTATIEPNRLGPSQTQFWATWKLRHQDLDYGTVLLVSPNGRRG